MTLTAEKLCLAVVVAVVTSGAADATFFTYPEWDALTTAGKSAYIAGAFDSLEFFGISGAETGATMHYHRCLQSIKMNNSQLADGVRAVALNEPELQGKPVQFALIKYLNKLCGALPE
jgi:hypothetical protein